MTHKPFAITLSPASSLANKTGAWRTEQPRYVHRMPPCNDACPAGENVQGWLFHAEEGNYEQAWRVLVADNPFPAVMGRVCYHNCETACNRGQLDESVGINAVERFLGDEAIRQGWTVDAPTTQTGKRVLVVGSGPSGLGCAWHLRLRGHEVVVRDAAPLAGGMLRYGIPKYRLPREVLDAEVARIASIGVTLELDTKVEDVMKTMADEKFDAVFMSIGAHVGRRAYIPAGEAARILDAVSVLRSMEGEEKPQLGRRVVVYGGGNTAMDVARTARRLGAEEAVVVYRRTRERMPAHDFEVEEALEEGVHMKWLSTITQVGDDGKLVIEKMELDETGFPQPTGEFEELETDCVVLALGQDVDLDPVVKVPDIEVDHGVVHVSDNMMTGHPGIFAGGDMVDSERTVTVAIGHGKHAARNIDEYLGSPNTDLYRDLPRPEIATFDMLNPWYFSDAPKTVRPQLEIARRHSTFDEVTGGLDESNALFEARRCMSCGNCLACDNCYGVCPDNAVIKLEPAGAYQYEVDLDYCKGCALCVTECPAGAMKMVPEEI